MTEKPQMSAQEASWHEHLAGMRAKAEARKSGADPAAIYAVASSTAGTRIVAGYELKPANQGTVWTLQRVAKEFAEWANNIGMPEQGSAEEPGTRQMLELGLTTLVFADPKGCWLAMDAGNLESLITQAESFIWDTSLEDQTELQNHFQKQMEVLAALNPSNEPPKKKQDQEPHGT